LTHYTIELVDGTLLLGEIHGNGGVLKSSKDVTFWIDEQLTEEVSLEDKWAGDVKVWTTPKPTYLKASQIFKVFQESFQIWPPLV
jgi:hypothetical protein